MLIGSLGDGLELRLLELRHAPQLFELTKANLDRLYWMPREIDEAESASRIRKGLERLAEASGVSAGIFDHGALCGVVGLFRIDDRRETGEMGYWVGAGNEGRGIATRACRAMLQYAFDERGLHRVELGIAASNARSAALAERLGFTLEGRLREADRLVDGTRDDLLVYGLLAEDWRRGR
jgi:ribosomal-protein-serine acetyltransferase